MTQRERGREGEAEPEPELVYVATLGRTTDIFRVIGMQVTFISLALPYKYICLICIYVCPCAHVQVSKLARR